MRPGRSINACMSAYSRAGKISTIPACDSSCVSGSSSAASGHKARDGPALPAAKDGPHSRQQLPNLERLDEVIVGAEIEAPDPIVEPIARRNDEHRRVQPLAPRGLQQVETVSAGQAQIEQNDRMRAVAQRGLGLPSVAHPVDGHAFRLERARQALSNHHVVFDQQNAHYIRPGKSWRARSDAVESPIVRRMQQRARESLLEISGGRRQWFRT